jgi:hypothetical protein
MLRLKVVLRKPNGEVGNKKFWASYHLGFKKKRCSCVLYHVIKFMGWVFGAIAKERYNLCKPNIE